MEIWLIGYAPYIDPELIANDDVPTSWNFWNDAP